ncbi:unnamed protein product, partial [Laminaria digitata]
LVDITILVTWKTKALPTLVDPLLSRGRKLSERVIHPPAVLAAALQAMQARSSSRPRAVQNHLFQSGRLLRPMPTLNPYTLHQQARRDLSSPSHPRRMAACPRHSRAAATPPLWQLRPDQAGW